MLDASLFLFVSIYPMKIEVLATLNTAFNVHLDYRTITADQTNHKNTYKIAKTELPCKSDFARVAFDVLWFLNRKLIKPKQL